MRLRRRRVGWLKKMGMGWVRVMDCAVETGMLHDRDSGWDHLGEDWKKGQGVRYRPGGVGI